MFNSKNYLFYGLLLAICLIIPFNKLSAAQLQNDLIYLQDSLYNETLIDECPGFLSDYPYGQSSTSERECEGEYQKIVTILSKAMPRVYQAIRKNTNTLEEKLDRLKKVYDTVLKMSEKVDAKDKEKLFTYAALHYLLGKQIDALQMKEGNNLVNQYSILQLPSNEYNFLDTEDEEDQKYFSLRRVFKNANIWFTNQDDTIGRITLIETKKTPATFLDTLWWVWHAENIDSRFLDANNITSSVGEWKSFAAGADTYWYVLQVGDTYVYMSDGVGERWCYPWEKCINPVDLINKIKIQ